MNIYLDLFLTFLKLGATTFGGGYAMIAQLNDIVVKKKRWMTNDELLEICGIAESTPGPIAINLATFIGYKKGKLLGSVLSTLGVIFPAFLFIFIISLFLNKLMENLYVQYALVGIKCAVAYLITKAGIDMFIKMKKNIWQKIIIISVIFIMVLLDLFALNFSSIFLILIGAALGIILSMIKERKTL